MAKDYYSILGVARDAAQEEIKKAYRRLARQYHPDVNPGNKQAEEKFKEINEAFSVLGDAQKRQQYNQFGSAEPGFGQGFRGFEGFEDLFSSFGFDDIFDVFGSRRAGRRGEPGADLRYDMEITLEEAFDGAAKHIEIPRFERCSACRGTGARDAQQKTCPQCNGSGERRTVRRMGFAQFVSVEACARCNGSGRIAEAQCQHCKGSGRVRRTRKIEVKIPAGVDEGSHMRLAGEGEPGTNGAADGDLYVVTHVKPHPTLERQGDNLFERATIGFAQAALGAEIEVPLMRGTAKLKIPAGTQSHTLFRLRGHGMPNLRTGRRGDLIVRVEVAVPKTLTQEQRRLVEELAELGEAPQAGKGFFDRAKEYFS
jgi:molecular chaperone DnaJ